MKALARVRVLISATSRFTEWFTAPPGRAPADCPRGSRARETVWSRAFPIAIWGDYDPEWAAGDDEGDRTPQSSPASPAQPRPFIGGSLDNSVFMGGSSPHSAKLVVAKRPRTQRRAPGGRAEECPWVLFPLRLIDSLFFLLGMKPKLFLWPEFLTQRNGTAVLPHGTH